MFSINQHLYSHDCFSKNIKPFLCKQKLVNKNIENFVWFPKQYLLGFFILDKQLTNIWTGVSCFYVTLFYFTHFCCGGKANLVRLTLFYSTLLTLTDRLNYRRTNTLAARGLEELFLQLCCCVSFWFWRGIGFGFTYLCT